MSFYNSTVDVLKRNTIEPGKRILSAKPASMFDFGTPVGAILTESVRLPLENIGHISNWTGRQIFNLVGKTLKLSFNLAMLTPLPFPNVRNIASIRGRMNAMVQAFREKTRGNPETFSQVFARIRGIRNDAAARAINGQATPLPA